MYRSNFGPPRGRGGGSGGIRGGRGGFPSTGPVSAGANEFAGLLDSLMKQPPPPPARVNPPSSVASSNTAPLQARVNPPSSVASSNTTPPQARVNPPLFAPSTNATPTPPRVDAPAFVPSRVTTSPPPRVNAPVFVPSRDTTLPPSRVSAPAFVPSRDTTPPPAFVNPPSSGAPTSAIPQPARVNSSFSVMTQPPRVNPPSFAAPANTAVNQDSGAVPLKSSNSSSAFQEIPIPLPDDLKNAIREIENLTPVLDMVGKPEKLIINEFYLVKLPGRNSYGRAQVLHADDKQRRAFVFFVDYVAGASVSYDTICSFPPYDSWFITPPFMKKTISC